VRIRSARKTRAGFYVRQRRCELLDTSAASTRILHIEESYSVSDSISVFRVTNHKHSSDMNGEGTDQSPTVLSRAIWVLIFSIRSSLNWYWALAAEVALSPCCQNKLLAAWIAFISSYRAAILPWVLGLVPQPMPFRLHRPPCMLCGAFQVREQAIEERRSRGSHAGNVRCRSGSRGPFTTVSEGGSFTRWRAAR
jgi:hypothetical protein